ncbi:MULTISPECIES: cysteine desulfurase family protein [unclassified Pseudoalteromonas]|uniref:cysteine desulfurase family protein n=1 Tax=unclassified Pseudoalteromonas TaxID=194690 RepID=UPI003014CD07
MEKKIAGYLDYSATTPLDNEVILAMQESLGSYANPSSSYSIAWQNKKTIALARKVLANILQVQVNSIFFTSGGTEANNTAIKGRAMIFLDSPGHIVCSSIEHASVLEAVTWCQDVLGFEVTYVDPDRNGVVQVETVLDALTENTKIVTLMAVNNELGTKQPIAALGEALFRDRPDIFFHVDAVQAFGKTDLNLSELNIDSLAISAHKIYGPKGTGALYLKNPDMTYSLIHGGGQELGFRGGTENILGVVGFTRALELLEINKYKDEVSVAAQKKLFINLIKRYFPDATFNGSDDEVLCQNNIVSVSFPGFQSETLLERLDLLYGIRVSRGSACSENKVQKVSNVLIAIGMTPSEAESTIRVSFGRYSDEQDVRKLVKGLIEITNHEMA